MHRFGKGVGVQRIQWFRDVSWGFEASILGFIAFGLKRLGG